MEMIHETATDMLKSGAITKKRMEEYDETCLVKEEKAPAKKIHKINGRAKIAKQNILEKAS